MLLGTAPVCSSPASDFAETAGWGCGPSGVTDCDGDGVVDEGRCMGCEQRLRGGYGG